MRRWSHWLLCAALTLGGEARAEDLPAASRRVADSLATILAAGGEGVTSVALLPFGEGAGVMPGQGRMAAELVSARLAQAARVKVLDGAALKAAVGEQRLQAMLGSGRVDEPELASRTGAQASLTGQLALDGERVRLSVKLAALPSGRPIGAAQAVADPPGRPAAGESGAIEVAMRRLSDGLAAGFGRIPGSTRYRRLAVLTFGEVGERAAKRRLGTIVTAEVATNLRRDHGLFLVERARLGEVLGELKLQQMASPDAAQASKIGQLADAQALVIGSVAEAGDRYLVTARIVATQSGETLAAESASVAEVGMTAIASDAVVLRSRGDAAFRSLLVPGLGQFYNRQPVKGWAFLGTEVGLLGGALGFHLAGAKAYDDYKAFGGGGAAPSAEAARLYDQATSRYRTRDWLLVGAGAVWALNLVDAWVSGVDGQALLGGGAVAAAPVPLDGGAGVVVAGRF
ncbi:MAG TPA: FlgO family outer membrane protein [Anaeromyxobacteraceae bacterium]|nr:FlgO family outer membrane protein [Anaeromyxobacteraceae bacterium]